MGQLLNKEPTSPCDRALLDHLKKKDLRDLAECIEIINESYPSCTNLTYEQFEDVFCGLLNDTEPYFLQLQNDRDISKTVDLFETIACLAIFCGDKFEDKLQYIFSLFDFDRSGSIEKNELIMTLQSAVRAICKFVNIVPPSIKTCEEAADNIFSLIDHDGNKKLSLKEFSFWITNNNEVQEFCLKYAGTQTFENLEKRFTQIKTFYKCLFDRCGDKEAQTVPADDLHSLFNIECKGKISEANVEYLFDLFLSTSTHVLGSQNEKMRLIERQSYVGIMRAWSCFSAADINNDDALSSKELGNMIWIYENDQPDPSRLQRDLKEIDKDNSGCINRKEWMKHLCTYDEKTGKYIFDAQLFQLFEKYDKDNSGYLRKDEIILMLQDMFKEYYRAADKSSDKSRMDLLNQMITDLQEEIVAGLEIDKEGTISWHEFKKYIEVSQEKQEKLKKFLSDNLIN